MQAENMHNPEKPEIVKPTRYEYLKSQTREVVIQAFIDALTMTREGIQDMADAYRVCVENDWVNDLPSLPGWTTFLKYLPRISEGSIDAGGAFECMGNMNLLRQFAALPLREQKRLANGGTVKLAVVAPDGSMDHRAVTLGVLAADPNAIKQVFDNGRIRDVAEQFVKKQLSAPPVPITALLTLSNGIVVDSARDGFIVKGQFFSREEWDTARAALPTQPKRKP
jgi:hypothetical protein